MTLSQRTCSTCKTHGCCAARVVAEDARHELHFGVFRHHRMAQVLARAVLCHHVSQSQRCEYENNHRHARCNRINLNAYVPSALLRSCAWPDPNVCILSKLSEFSSFDTSPSYVSTMLFFFSRRTRADARFRSSLENQRTRTNCHDSLLLRHVRIRTIDKRTVAGVGHPLLGASGRLRGGRASA